MSAVWRVSRAAVRRRRLQTTVIGFVVLVSTATIVLALGLLAASSGPFDRAYAQQRGAHLVATFDDTRVTGAQLAQTATQPGVNATAGPFGQVVLTIPANKDLPPEALTVVGRADPGGPVDRLNVWQGRWTTGPGEIVLNRTPGGAGPPSLGTRIAVAGRRVLTVVGYAYSVSQSADAWVTPGQLAALHPTATQMLYRFAHAATAAQISADQAAVTAGLAPGTLLGSQNYLASRATAGSGPGTYLPFLMVFGLLGLAVAVLIVANVVSGAVVAGFRPIGVLKALGFTPTQVMAVYLVMVGVPAVVGTVVGTVLGNVLAKPVLSNAFEDYGAGDTSVASWVDAAAVLGMPALVVVSALVPALRARSLSASQAISAGSVQQAGRGLRIQRWLTGTRLPRSVSLGLGLPFARPARSALTLAAVVLGVLSVTFATGLTRSVIAYEDSTHPSGTDLIQVATRGPGGPAGPAGPGIPGSRPGASAAPTLSDPADESMLRALPGALHVAAVAQQQVHVVGELQSATVLFFRGDSGRYVPAVVKGHWPDGPGQVAANARFLHQRGLALGDTITVELGTVELGGRRTSARIVGDVLTNYADGIFSDWQTLALLAPGTRADSYQVQLRRGTDEQAYMAAVDAADPGLQPMPSGGSNSGGAKLVTGTSLLLTLMLGTVAALGVFNTVVLNTRERRRDLGMLKSIGMTPRQVTVMMVTSMGALGAVGGLIGVPLGFGAHRLVAPAMMHAGQADVTGLVLNVLHPPMLALLGLAGIAIAVLGAFIPARSAARMTIAEVLHNE